MKGQPDRRMLLDGLERFRVLLEDHATSETQLQSLFAECPFILSRSLPLRVDHRRIEALGRPGKSEPDFVIHPEPTQFGSPRGIIEIKTPWKPVLTFPRKDQVILSRDAATAVNQVHVYASQPWWPDRVVVAGNDLYLFVIMGLSATWADRIQREIIQEQLGRHLGNVSLLGYDQVFQNYTQTLPRRVLLLVPAKAVGTPASDKPIGDGIDYTKRCYKCLGSLTMIRGAMRCLSCDEFDPYWDEDDHANFL